jgi:hypothetical protein
MRNNAVRGVLNAYVDVWVAKTGVGLRVYITNVLCPSPLAYLQLESIPLEAQVSMFCIAMHNRKHDVQQVYQFMGAVKFH